MDTQLKELFEDLSKLQAKLPNPTKSRHVDFVSKRTGQRTKYSYADLAETREMIQPILSEFGFSIVQFFSENNSKSYMTTWLCHRSGEKLTSSIAIDLNADMQEVGSRITYLRRYSLFAILGLVGEEDDDGASADDADKSKRQTPRPQDVPKEVQKPKEEKAAITAAHLLKEGQPKGWNIEQMKEYMLTRYNCHSSSAMPYDALKEMLNIVKTKDFMTAISEITI